MKVRKGVAAMVCVFLCVWGLLLLQDGSHTAFAEELLIILPYKSSSSIAIQEDLEWITIGESFADYKEATGISTRVMTLEDIVAGYSGVDEQEKIKRAIYSNVINRHVEYVILVGDMGVFPVRYQLRGYTSDGAIYYAYDEDTATWSPYPFYRFFPSDGYYSNLWHNDDAGKAFDDWNDDGDGFFGEMYYDNVRGIDGNSIHPDVALGRVPCRTPAEFLTYVTKVQFYENFVADAPSRNTGLFVVGTFGDCRGTKQNVESAFSGTLDVTYVIKADGSYTVEDSGGTTSIAVADTYITDFITDHHPRFVNYAGHGAPNSWSEMAFGVGDASALPFSDIPAIVFGSSCSTGRFAEDVWLDSPPAALPALSDNDSMAEGFLTRATGGGVIYIGCVTTAQPTSHYMDERFFGALADGASKAGDAWLSTIEQLIDHYGLDTFTRSTWITVDGWPDPDRDGKWDWYPVSQFQHVYKMHFFGDPSLRVSGVSVPDRTPPVTIAFMRNWVNEADLLAPQPYVHEMTLRAHDAVSPVTGTFYNYWYHDLWNFWRTGTECLIPLTLTRSWEGDTLTVGYYSADLLGNVEAANYEEVGFDFTPPVSSVEVDGETLPTTVGDGIVVDARSFTITATDNLSGIDRIEYTYGDGSRWSYDMGSILDINIDPCFSFSGTTLRYRAIDGAGNVEDEKTLTLNIESMSSATWRACFERPIEEIYQFPPSLLDTLVDLRFVESIAGLIPEEVAYYYSGPVNELYKEDVWTSIGNAVRNAKTETWDVSWDTAKAGILNGFYWVRAALDKGPVLQTMSSGLEPNAEPVENEPFLVLINNLTEQDYTLNIQSDSKSVGPGGNVSVDVGFKNIRFDTLNNVEMGLILDKDLAGEKEASFSKKKQALKKGETWGEKFEFSIAEDTNLSDALSVHAYVRANEIGLLLSKEQSFVLQRRDINVVGAVQDTLGVPLDVKLVLKGHGTSRDVSSDKDGAYAFEDVAPGTYTLEATGAPAGYRQVYPPKSPVSFESLGKDMEMNFAFARKDRTPPTLTQELDWSLAAKYGLLYGIAYDDPYGTGVSEVRIAIVDRQTGTSCSATGTLDVKEGWLTPDQFVSLNDFLGKQGDTVLARLPEQERTIQKDKIEALYGGLDAVYGPRIWSLSLVKPCSLVGGRIVVTGKASDVAGNAQEKALASTPVSAGFAAAPLLGPAPLTVHFKDKSDGPGTEWQWDFGDGETGTERNPTHVYETAGTYSVTMMVYNMNNSDGKTRTDLITVAAGAPPKDVYPKNGIWKSDDGLVSFYLQKYETGACAVVATAGDGTYSAFLDASYKDGVSVTDDLDGKEYSFDLLLTDSEHGTAAVVLPGGGAVTRTVSLVFESNREHTKIPADGIWKSTDGSLNCYLQKYEADSCVLVVTVGSGYVPFLDPDYADGLSLSDNLDQNGLTLEFNMTDASHGILNVMLPGFGTLSKPMTLTYPDTP